MLELSAVLFGLYDFVRICSAVHTNRSQFTFCCHFDSSWQCFVKVDGFSRSKFVSRAGWPTVEENTSSPSKQAGVMVGTCVQ